MDLNVPPSPEDDDQYRQYSDQDANYAPLQSESVVTMNREREERRQRLKRVNRDENSNHISQPSKKDYMQQTRSSGSYGRGRKLPEGWLNCPNFGQPIECMIPSKVPLDESYSDLVPPGRRYSSKQVINSLRVKKMELGLVIDLTNSTRYYSPSSWLTQGIKHRKIACVGRDAVPDPASVNEFVYEVDQFISRQKNSKKYILVHCTHGHNRTGFMIINYLMRYVPSMNVSKAITIFAQSRYPGIYKKDYIDALYKIYHEIPESLTCPSTPDWKRSSDLDLNGEAMPEEDDDGNAEVILNEEVENKIITNDDVLGDATPYEQQDLMRQVCYILFELAPSGRGTVQFPGSHPVSLNRENLQLLRQRYYYATWKADGTRYMMLLTSYGCFLIDRNFCFRRIQMRFPLNNFKGLHHMTLLDGEMIIDKLPDSGLKRRYLIYDLVALNNRSVVKLPFSERWKLLEDEVIRPRNYERQLFEAGKINMFYRYDMEPFSVRQKGFWLLSTVTKLLKEFIPNLCHEADGLIFQGWDDPYVPRTHEGLLKWKYPEMNSVDFLFEIGSENRRLLFLFERGKKKLMDGAEVVFPGGEDVSTLSGKIVECSWDADAGCWTCMRIRTDKSTPNDINTYRKVMRSIKDNITEELLLDEISEIITLPMYEDRIKEAEAKKHQHRRRPRA